MPRLGRWGAWFAVDGGSPLEQSTFLNVYRNMRVTAFLAVLALVITIGGMVDHRAIEVSIMAMALAGIAHARLRGHSPWIEMSLVDLTFLTLMATATDIAAVAMIVITSHVLVGWLFMPPRHAVIIAAYGLASGIASIFVVGLYDIRPEILGVNLLITVSVLVATTVIVSWLMLTVGRSVRSQRLQVEDLLRDKDRLLDEKTQLIAGVSHELRTPLTGVIGFASELATNASGMSYAEIADLADVIATSSNELSALVEDLLVAARLENGSLSVEQEPLDLAGVIGDLTTEHAIDVTGVRVIGDPLRIRQIIRNLLTNADRYGGPVVKMSCTIANDEVAIIVSDNGSGVPEDAVEQIFEPFGRAHGRPGRVDAVGLGLAISRQLAEMMGGDLRYTRSESWTHFELALRAPGNEPADLAPVDDPAPMEVA